MGVWMEDLDLVKVLEQDPFEIETEEIYSADYSGCFPVSNPADLSDDNALYDGAIYGSGRCFRWTI